MNGGRIALLIVGVLLALLGFGAAAGGVGMVWADGTQRGPDGFVETPDFTLTTHRHALRTEEIHLDVRRADEWVPWVEELAVRIEVAPTTERPVFIGVGPSADVDAYLTDVSHAEVTRLGPASDDVAYVDVAGPRTPQPPATQTFWETHVEGTGAQRLAWDLVPGDWAIVVMNADASPGVAVIASAGALAEFLQPVGIGLLVFGAVLLLGAAALIVAATASGSPPPHGGDQGGASPAERGSVAVHPVAISGHLDEPISRALWLVKWLLVIPHMVVLLFLWLAFAVMTLVAGIAILFTGRYPESIFAFNVGVLRWTWRVAFYSYSALGTDAYPPFTLEVADHPATFDVAYPSQLSRGLVLVKWLLAIPHLLIVGVLVGGGLTWTFGDGGAGTAGQGGGAGLIGVLVFVAGLVLLFRGRYPRGLFDLVMGLNRWVYRVTAYVALMTDVYPPFRLDAGGDEPRPPAGPPPNDPPLGQRADPPVAHRA